MTTRLPASTQTATATRPTRRGTPRRFPVGTASLTGAGIGTVATIGAGVLLGPAGVALAAGAILAVPAGVILNRSRARARRRQPRVRRPRPPRPPRRLARARSTGIPPARHAAPGARGGWGWLFGRDRGNGGNRATPTGGQQARKPTSTPTAPATRTTKPTTTKPTTLKPTTAPKAPATPRTSRQTQTPKTPKAPNRTPRQPSAAPSGFSPGRAAWAATAPIRAAYNGTRTKGSPRDAARGAWRAAVDAGPPPTRSQVGRAAAGVLGAGIAATARGVANGARKLRDAYAEPATPERTPTGPATPATKPVDEHPVPAPRGRPSPHPRPGTRTTPRPTTPGGPMARLITPGHPAFPPAAYLAEFYASCANWTLAGEQGYLGALWRFQDSLPLIHQAAAHFANGMAVVGNEANRGLAPGSPGGVHPVLMDAFSEAFKAANSAAAIIGAMPGTFTRVHGDDLLRAGNPSARVSDVAPLVRR